METYKHGLLSINELLPNQLDFDRSLARRQVDVDQRLLDSLKRFEAGLAGENIVVEYLREFGRKHWVIIRGLWLDDFGTSECDVVVLTGVGVHTFEVKNYIGDFVFENSACMLNGRKLKHNVVSQAAKAQATLKEVCQNYSRNVQVSGALVFVGIDNTVEIRSPIDDIQVVSRSGLRKHIQSIANAEDNARYVSTLDQRGLIQHLKNVAVSNPYLPDPLTPAEIRSLRKGIYCAYCGNFDVEIRQRYAICGCGLHEPRDEAIVRTIYEYAVLTYDRPMRRADLLDFFGGDISKIFVS